MTEIGPEGALIDLGPLGGKTWATIKELSPEDVKGFALGELERLGAESLGMELRETISFEIKFEPAPREFSFDATPGKMPRKLKKSLNKWRLGKLLTAGDVERINRSRITWKVTRWNL